MAIEFRGCKNLVIAEVTADTDTEYTTGDVMTLAPVAEISKSVDTSSAAHYYDNKAAIIINSEGEDTVTFTCAVPDDETLALITGRTYDSTKKMFIESERTQRYFAVGYIIGEVGEGEDERYVWRYKGTFNIPDESVKTKDNGTDASNLSVVFTGIYTQHKFANGKGTGIAGAAKAMFIRQSSEVATPTQFFSTVATPDTSFPAYTLTETVATNTTLTVTRNGVPLDNNSVIFTGDVLTITVTGGTVKVNGTSFTSGNTYTVSGNTTVVTTAGA